MRGDPQFGELPEDVMLLVNGLCNDLERRRQAGQQPRLETLIEALDTAHRSAALTELIPIEIEYRRAAGETVDALDYKTRFPQLDPTWLKQVCHVEGPAKPSTPGAPRPLRVLAGYELLIKLGGGGMGTVYKAMHQRLQREVALKVLRGDLKNNPQFVARFQREVQTAARLLHPNIVAAYDAGFEKGFYYLITELVDGADLDRLVRTQGPLTAEASIDYITQAARGLAYAHQQKVIHRDIKPANILLDGRGVVKILDMGLARLTDKAPVAETIGLLTETAQIMGTAAFMAPEQARSTKNADERSDVYSLGCTLYFLLTGRPMYVGESAMDILLAQVSQPIPRLETDGQGRPISPGLREVFEKMVAKNPAARFERMEDVIEALAQSSRAPVETVRAMVATAAPVVATVALPSVRFNPAKTIRRRRAMPTRWLLAGAGAAALVVVGLALWSQHQPDSGLAPPRTTEDVIAKRPAEPPTPKNDTTPPTPITSPTKTSPAVSPNGQRFALWFNGGSGYVAVPSLEPDPAMPVTLEVIVLTQQRQVSNVMSWLGPDWPAIFMTPEGRWGIGRKVGDESHLHAVIGAAPLNQWQHVAATAEGAQLAIYVDGERRRTDEIPYQLGDTTGGLHIGGIPTDRRPVGEGPRWFYGQVDELRISRGLRYRDSFTPLKSFENDDSTLVLYRFDEGEGNQARDSSGHGHHGRIYDARYRPVE